jgi:hypothetical protein
MRTTKILIVLGLISLFAGTGIHYIVDHSGQMAIMDTTQAPGQAAAVDVFVPPANLVHCGESTMSKTGKLINQEAYACFEQHLLNCAPADFVAVVDGGNIKYSRTIMERQGQQCMVRESYLSIAKHDLIGKGMTCAYNPMLPMTQEINYRNCTGALRDELFNRLP